nr:HlyD family type I secretion periplasmic adaptor subunit [Lysobacter sp. TY2-98]
MFKAAWSARGELESPSRTADELAFLPAHLELVETPTSPLPRWTLRILMALIAVAIAWACIGELDIVAVAPGKVVVGSRSKVIQSAETAVVTRIHVQDGQAVRKGQLLIELDRSATGADYAKADEALIAAKLAELRLQALADALASGKPPSLGSAQGLPALRYTNEQALARSQFDAFNARRDSLIAAINQRRAELATAQGLVEPLAETARIAETRSADYAKLVEDKYVTRHDYLAREQERIAAERDLAAQKSRLAEIRSTLSEAQEQLRVLITDTRQHTLDQLRVAREQVGQFEPELAKADSRNRLMQLRAPTDGTVQQLAIHTQGGVVTPAQPLLVLVPKSDALEVEATVLNKDIGFVRAGQPVTVKIDSFPYTRYGYLRGVVESVSHDAAQDEKLGLVFPARIRLQTATLDVDGAVLRVTPGMSLSTEIKTGKQRLAAYLLGALRKQTGEALRER